MKLGIDLMGLFFSMLALFFGSPIVGIAGLLYFGTLVGAGWSQRQ